MKYGIEKKIYDKQTICHHQLSTFTLTLTMHKIIKKENEYLARNKEEETEDEKKKIRGGEKKREQKEGVRAREEREKIGTAGVIIAVVVIAVVVVLVVVFVVVVFIVVVVVVVFVVVVVAVVHLKSFHPQKPLFLSFKNNTGQTYRQTDRRTDGHDLLQRCVVASKKWQKNFCLYFL